MAHPTRAGKSGRKVGGVDADTGESSGTGFQMVVFFSIIFLILFIYVWLCWVFIPVQAFSPVQRVRATPQLQGTGFSLWRRFVSWRTGSRADMWAQQLCSQALGHRCYGCGARAELLHGLWDPPGPGIKLRSPVLAGRLHHYTTREAPKWSL